MRVIRYGAWAAVAALSLIIAVVYAVSGQSRDGAAGASASAIGGPFTLTTHEGEKLSSEDLKGKPFVVFFGFTYCPEVCPTTLLELSQTIKELGAAADGMRFLFISVDPERDTPEVLGTYLSSFDPHITGLTGTPEEIAAVAKAYRVTYEKVPTSGGDYTMNHTALVYLMDAKGVFKGVLALGVLPEKRLEKLKSLLGSSGT
jgi:protein SCO1/2